MLQYSALWSALLLATICSCASIPRGAVATEADVKAILKAIDTSSSDTQSVVGNNNRTTVNHYDRLTSVILTGLVALVLFHYTVGKTVNRIIIAILTRIFQRKSQRSRS